VPLRNCSLILEILSPDFTPVKAVINKSHVYGLLTSTREVKPIWILLKQRVSEWQWYLLGHMQLCTSLQIDNHASTPPLSFFTGRMPFLPPNQQRQSTEDTASERQCHLFPRIFCWERTGRKVRGIDS